MPKPITVGAVVKYAAALYAEGEREIRDDPFASPYRPTEASARKLSSLKGPEEAIAYMRKRAAMHKRTVREETAVAHSSLVVHKARQRNHLSAEQKRRARLSAGVRIDAAIARLSVIASPAAAQLGQSVHGGTPDHVPPFCADVASEARRLALLCALELEALERGLRVRDVSEAA